MTQELKGADFQEKVLNNSTKPIVVEVWAGWCHNCKVLEPIYQATAEDIGNNAEFYQLKADDNQMLVKSLKLMGVPTLLFYKHGVLIAKKTGVKSQKTITKILEPLINYSQEEAMANKHVGLLKRIFG